MVGGEPELGASLFPINGLDHRPYRFRVLRVDELLPIDGRSPSRLNKWATTLWRLHLKSPVYPSSEGGSTVFLTPESGAPPPGRVFEMRDVPDRTYHIRVSESIRTVSVAGALPEERELVSRMIERSFTDRFTQLTGRYWRAEWTLFYRMKPENSDVATDAIDAYRGLKFGVVFLSGGKPFLAADVRTRYIGRHALSACTREEKEGPLRDHLAVGGSGGPRPTFVRDNGPRRISCHYVGETGKSVGEFFFGDPPESVFDYYQRIHPTVKLEPNDEAVYVVDRADSPPIAVPSSRLFPVFTTEYGGVRDCSTSPQLPPTDRVQIIKQILAELDSVTYEGSSLKVGSEILHAPRTLFMPPRLEFGRGATLDPREKERGPSEDNLDSRIMHWGMRKMPAIYQNGPFHLEPFPEPVLLYPANLPREIRESFCKAMNDECFRQTGRPLVFSAQRSYAVGPGERGGHSLLTDAKRVSSESQRRLLVVVLWDGLDDRVHGDLKDELGGSPSQCVTERGVRDIVSKISPRATSRLRYLALAVAIEGGTQPWVLADPLHHDIHVGIDVLYGRVGYNFLYDVGGRRVFREAGWATHRAQSVEAIKRPELARMLSDGLRRIRADGRPARSIVVHRDGRWWPSESEGFHEALRTLTREGVLSKDLRYAVVEIRKHHAPIRLFTRDVAAGRTQLRNPLPGTYLPLDESRIVLTTTGRPGQWDSSRGRTAGTLLLNVVERAGRVDAVEIAEDAYHLTHLNWNAPDIEVSLPVTIRWADDALRETLPSISDRSTDEPEEDDEAEDETGKDGVEELVDE